MNVFWSKKNGLAAIFIIVALNSALYASAAAIEDLRRNIEEKNKAIQTLEEEARKYRLEIAQHQRVGATLQNEIRRNDGVIAKIGRDIALTQIKIERTGLEIEALKIEISEKGRSMTKLKSGLASLLEAFREQQEEPLLFILIKQSSLSDFFRYIDYTAFLKEKIVTSLDTLRVIRQEFEVKKAEAQAKKTELEDLEDLMNGRKKVELGAKSERTAILIATKNQEKKYQELLLEQERKRAALEEEIRDIENQIRFTLDPSALPQKGRGVLGYPLPEVSLASCWNGGENAKNCLTQYFGYTGFASRGGYGGGGHNGVDFRADIGTPVFAAGDGKMEAVGDTDEGCRRASYGKWILIRHPNNLSTIYAHLSGISVAAEQSVRRGERIGFSGKSGYATGPHLHLGVYAADAVRIESIRSKVCGRLMTLPIAAPSGYLNPLDYL